MIPLLIIFGAFLLYFFFKIQGPPAPPITKDARIISRRDDPGNVGFITVEFNDGSRQELWLFKKSYRLTKEGDRGKVRYKGNHCQGFDRSINYSPAPQYSNPVDRSSVHNTQSTHNNQQSQDKLQLGLQRLSKAGDDPDFLGMALISLHGALEDYFRSWLSSNSSVSPSKREVVLDARQMQWKGLLDLMQQYGSLNDNQRQYIFRMNRLRQDVGHGGQFTGTRSELENYADFVRGFVVDGSSSTSNNENYNNGSQQKGYDLRIDLKLSSREAISGTEKQIKLPYLEKCKACNGEGLERSENRCSDCNGTGRTEESKKLKVTIPAGVGNSTRLKVTGEGDAGIRGGSPGDLYIYLYVKENF